MYPIKAHIPMQVSPFDTMGHMLPFQGRQIADMGLLPDT